jgi:hypothetical protein
MDLKTCFVLLKVADETSRHWSVFCTVTRCAAHWLLPYRLRFVADFHVARYDLTTLLIEMGVIWDVISCRPFVKSFDCVWNVMAHAQKPHFVFRRNGRVHLNRRGRQFSRLLAAEVCASAVVMLDKPCTEVVWRVLATHSIPQFSLHFPSRASPCPIIFQLDSTGISEDRNASNFTAKQSKKSSVLYREFEDSTETSATLYHPPLHNITEDLNLSFQILSW